MLLLAAEHPHDNINAKVFTKGRVIKVKKEMKVIVTSMLAVIILAGCAKSSEPKESATASVVPSASTSTVATPMNLNIFYFDAAGLFKTDLPIFKKATEKTKVTLKNVAPSSGDAKQAYNLMLASGEIPDIISYNLSDLNNLGSQGALQPLNDLIEKNAPNFAKFLAERPDVRKAITLADGKIYTIPFVADGSATTGWFVRKDWLDKLGLQAPKTVDEYYNVLKAFREKDPNGNGKKDEIPYFNRLANASVPLAQTNELLPLWDSFYSFYIKDGKLAFGPSEPQYKTAMGNIAKWFKEGLIDPEIFTRQKAREVLLGGNTGGSTHDWFASTAAFNTSLQKENPGLNFVPVTPPASQGGKVFEVGKRAILGGSGWAMSAKTKDPAAVMRYFDFWWTEEGRNMFNFGIDGDSYTMVDNKPKFTEKTLSQTPVLGYLVTNYGAQSSGMGAWQNFAYEEQWTNPVALAGIKEYQDKKYISSDYTLPSLNFTEAEQKRINEIKPKLDTIIAEMGQKWILGAADIEGTYQSYLDNLKKNNLDEYIKINQDAFDRYNKK